MCNYNVFFHICHIYHDICELIREIMKAIVALSQGQDIVTAIFYVDLPCVFRDEFEGNIKKACEGSRWERDEPMVWVSLQHVRECAT